MASHAPAAHAHQGHHTEHVEGLSRGMAGMVFFCASEIMLFGALFAGYMFVRNQAVEWPPAAVEHHLSVSIAAILTVLLVSSSVTAHIGILGLKQGNQAVFRTGLALTLILGTVFIGGQIWEWFTLMDEGLTAGSTVYGSTFYLITGFHGAHVIAGLAMLWVVFGRALMQDFTAQRHLFADAAVFYWHFVDVIWVFVFLILYVSAQP